MGLTSVQGFHCERCAYEWVPRDRGQEPTCCAGCKSPYWNKPRKKGPPSPVSSVPEKSTVPHLKRRTTRWRKRRVGPETALVSAGDNRGIPTTLTLQSLGRGACFESVLRVLCDEIETPPHPNRGRKPTPLRDVVYACVHKVYEASSARKARASLLSCRTRGWIGVAPSYNSVFHHMATSVMTDLLLRLVSGSVKVLVGSEGGPQRPVGVTCLFSTLARRGRGTLSSSSVSLRAFVDEATGCFLSPVVSVRSGEAPPSSSGKRTQSPATLYVEEMMIRFGTSVRSQTPVAQTNEVLAKCLCHNITRVVSLCAGDCGVGEVVG